MPILKKQNFPVLLFTLAAVVLYSAYFITSQNYEFMAYIAVIVFFGGLVLLTDKRVKYPTLLLWGLSTWALVHMSGGGLYIGETRLYEFMIVTLSEEYQIFRYDQFAHIYGFAVGTFLMWHLLKPLLKGTPKRWTAISIVIVMAGLGLGAFNEIEEFLITTFVPNTGVGGYINNSVDLVADLIGAMIAMVIIRYKETMV